MFPLNLYEVLTRDGWVSVESVLEQDILSYNSNTQLFGFDEIVSKQLVVNKEVYTIGCDNEFFKLSLDVPILIEDGVNQNIVSVSDINSDTKMFMCGKYDFPEGEDNLSKARSLAKTLTNSKARKSLSEMYNTVLSMTYNELNTLIDSCFKLNEESGNQSVHEVLQLALFLQSNYHSVYKPFKNGLFKDKHKVMDCTLIGLNTNDFIVVRYDKKLIYTFGILQSKTE